MGTNGIPFHCGFEWSYNTPFDAAPDGRSAIWWMRCSNGEAYQRPPRPLDQMGSDRDVCDNPSPSLADHPLYTLNISKLHRLYISLYCK